MLFVEKISQLILNAPKAEATQIRGPVRKMSTRIIYELQDYRLYS